MNGTSMYFIVLYRSIANQFHQITYICSVLNIMTSSEYIFFTVKFAMDLSLTVLKDRIKLIKREAVFD